MVIKSLPERLATTLAFGVLAALLCLSACTPPATDTAEPPPEAPAEITPEVRQAADQITTGDLVEVIRDLSSDDYQGRGPASDGDRAAQAYIVEKFQALGLEPGAADGGWYQPFDIVSIESTAPEVWSFQAGGQQLDLAWWDEYIAGSGVQSPTSVIDNAEVVFVGYGIDAPEHQWNDYGDVDVSGKVLLMMNNDPDWDPELFEGNRRLYYGRWSYKYEEAGRMGAAGAIIIHTRPSAGYPFQVVQTSWTGPQFELPDEGEPRSQINAWLSYEAAEKLVAMTGHSLQALEESARSRDFQPVPLGITTSLTLNNELARVETGNVLGLLRGGDEELADEVVVYTAHHDHLGVGQANADGDDIYNGARDNASGISQIIAIARAFKALPEPPRRSILFLAVGAEEQGLLGSELYARQPTFAPGKIAANINYDSASIWGRTRDLPLIGFGKSSLDGLAQKVAGLQGREVVGDRDPTQGSFYRSDQFNFAKIGVPALYFGQGTDFVDTSVELGPDVIEAWNMTNYHQPSDEYLDSWNLEGAVEDAKAGLFCGWLVSQTRELPGWNPGDEFEAARLEALGGTGAP